MKDLQIEYRTQHEIPNKMTGFPWKTGYHRTDRQAKNAQTATGRRSDIVWNPALWSEITNDGEQNHITCHNGWCVSPRDSLWDHERRIPFDQILGLNGDRIATIFHTVTRQASGSRLLDFEETARKFQAMIWAIVDWPSFDRHIKYNDRDLKDIWSKFIQLLIELELIYIEKVHHLFSDTAHFLRYILKQLNVISGLIALVDILMMRPHCWATSFEIWDDLNAWVSWQS
jgi:hypothetical protein